MADVETIAAIEDYFVVNDCFVVVAGASAHHKINTVYC